jgi:hypothetical protein
VVEILFDPYRYPTSPKRNLQLIRVPPLQAMLNLGGCTHYKNENSVITLQGIYTSVLDCELYRLFRASGGAPARLSKACFVVFRPRGDQKLASIFRPRSGRLGIWRPEEYCN